MSSKRKEPCEISEDLREEVERGMLRESKLHELREMLRGTFVGLNQEAIKGVQELYQSYVNDGVIVEEDRHSWNLYVMIMEITTDLLNN